VPSPKKTMRIGLKALKGAIEVKGIAALDLRTGAGQALLALRAELLAALGGESEISPQRKTVVELATRTRLYLDHADAWLLRQKTLISGKRRAILPIVMQQQTLADCRSPSSK